MKNRSLAKVHNEYADHFFNAYSTRIEFARNLPDDRNFEKVLLCCCYIDSLGFYHAGVNGLKTSNQEQFVKFLLLAEPKYLELEKVWLSGLKLKLQEEGEGKLGDYLEGWGLSLWNFSREGYDPDVTFSELSKRVRSELPQQEASRLLKEAINFKYPKIIWKQYRNLAVHEGRCRHAWDSRNGRTPFTSTPEIMDVKNGKWVRYSEVQLGIPSEFLLGCLGEAFESFKSSTLSSEQKTGDLYSVIKAVDTKTPYLFRTGPMFP